ncbi:hypothetical protein EJ997_10120 [Flaviflexus ciconiae]|uniref:HTH cro/C1-type domain-containing protein n=1 Tax=Flaviflexus ciconiae TaxID=2496867 RepID=A0A3S9PZ56_9ACTO|nr:helix-turn-helix transcriptional regulator [Flaviflexus ciconiae]AZQ77639.1 hypothetical protein EJ997_10120 [Flaviflexus ciconiae]
MTTPTTSMQGGFYLYLVEFGSNLTKVGITGNPKERIRQHRYTGKRIGHPMQRVWISEYPHLEAKVNELTIKGDSQTELLQRSFDSCLAQAETLPKTRGTTPSYFAELLAPAALKQFLKFRDMSYGQLAAKSGCSKALIGHLAAGRRDGTGNEIAQAICQAIDIPIEALFKPRTTDATSSDARLAVVASRNNGKTAA